MRNIKGKDIAVLIIFFNKISETIKCIDSFIPSAINIYVLNNGSEKKNWQILKSQYTGNQSLIFIHSDENLGPSQGRNKLIEASNEEWLFFVDNDITIEPQNNWLHSFYDFIIENTEAAIICPKLFNVHENEFAKHPKFVKKNNEIIIEELANEYGNYFPSGASIINRSIFLEHGLFDDKLFGFEDYEYSIRVVCSKKEKLSVFSMNDVILRHDHRFQKARIDKDSVKVRYNEKKLADSFSWIAEKHAIKFDHNWEWWSKKQVLDMTGKTIFQKAKQFLRNFYLSE